MPAGSQPINPDSIVLRRKAILKRKGWLRKMQGYSETGRLGREGDERRGRYSAVGAAGVQCAAPPHEELFRHFSAVPSPSEGCNS